MSGKTHSDENFPVSSFIIKKKIRHYVRTFYFFARTADDIADHENLKPSEKTKILNFFDKIIKKEKHTNVNVLNDLIKLFKEVPFGKKYSRELLKAFLMDASKKNYKNWEELENYCKFSANPVGRFVIDLVDKKERKNFHTNAIYKASDNLCTSLQIINHLQDCQIDYLKLKRVYIPDSFFKKYSISKKSLELKISCKSFKSLINDIVEKIEIMLDDSVDGLKKISSTRLRLETLIILNIAKRLCNLLKKKDLLRKKVKLSRIELIFCFIKGIINNYL